ncbi:MAG: hypothetical protein ACLU60_07945 [Faecalimonas sp.]
MITDIFMILLLLICFGSMKLLADWCEKQVGTAEERKKEKYYHVEEK